MSITYLDEEPKKVKFTYLDEEEQPKESIGRKLYREVGSPLLSGISTFALGIPKAVATKTGAKEIMYPEQETLLGKLLRGGSELAGFTIGAPGKLSVIAAKGVGKGMVKLGAGKTLTRLIKGVSAGAIGGAAMGGDTIEDRFDQAKIGAVLGGVTAAATPAIKWGFDKIAQTGRILSGIEKEVFEEAQKKGFNKVLQTKYYKKTLPAEIQDRIAQNIDDMQIEAGNEYDKLTKPLRESPFDMPQFRGDVIKAANRIKSNPFETDVSTLDNQILNGVVNKAKINNLGDALDVRRDLDDIIYSNKGELRSSFGKKVRDILNKELHKNKNLEAVDKEWTNFLDILREGKKVLSDTGEKILARFGSLTEKQKVILVSLEKKVGGLPFVEDLTNYSLTKEFITRKVSPSISGVVRATARPLLRGYLRQGEKATDILSRFDKETVGRLLGE